MANLYTELARRTGATYGDKIYVRSHWDLLDGKPTTYVPTAHAHDGLVYYVEGNTTGTAGTWTGTAAGLSAYVNGLTIIYRIGIAGASTTTVNINGLGAGTVYRRYVSSGDNTTLTTHYPVGTVLTMTYRDGYWLVTQDYDTSDDYNMRWINNVTAGTTITRYKIIMQGTNGQYYPLTTNDSTAEDGKVVSTQEFLLGGYILQYNSSSASYTAGQQFGSYYLWSQQYNSGILNYTFNQLSGWTASMPIYLKGTIQSNGTFRLDNTTTRSWLTQTLPTTDDGFVYIKLGYMHNTTTAWTLTADHPVYHYKNGALRRYVPGHEHHINEINGLLEATGFSGEYSPLFYIGADNRLFNHNGITFVGSTNTLKVSGAVEVGGQALVKTNDSRLSDSRPASDVYAWAKAANKPTYTAAEVGAAASSHSHNEYLAKTGGAMSGTTEIAPSAPSSYASDSNIIRFQHRENDTTYSRELKVLSDGKFVIDSDEIVTKTMPKGRSIKNFTSVNLNGTTEVSCAVTENPRNQIIGLHIEYQYMGQLHGQIAWLYFNNVTTQTTIVTIGGSLTLGTTASHQIHFNVYLKASDNTIYIKNAYFQTQNSSTSSADTMTAVTNGYVSIKDIIVL